MIEIGGQEPGGWIYVAHHLARPGLTKVGYLTWHPNEPCWKYQHGIKRLHRIEKHLVDFGFGPLEKWASPYHPEAKQLEKIIHRSLTMSLQKDGGSGREIFNIDPEAAKKIVLEQINAQTH
jgi:hypothetical protein